MPPLFQSLSVSAQQNGACLMERNVWYVSPSLARSKKQPLTWG